MWGKFDGKWKLCANEKELIDGSFHHIKKKDKIMKKIFVNKLKRKEISH